MQIICGRESWRMTKPPKVELIQYAQRVRFTHQMIRCEAIVGDGTARYRARAGKDYGCELSALYRVNGKCYCKRHAGDAVLVALVEDQPFVAS
jgi:hypothetical protein